MRALLAFLALALMAAPSASSQDSLNFDPADNVGLPKEILDLSLLSGCGPVGHFDLVRFQKENARILIQKCFTGQHPEERIVVATFYNVVARDGLNARIKEPVAFIFEKPKGGGKFKPYMAYVDEGGTDNGRLSRTWKRTGATIVGAVKGQMMFDRLRKKGADIYKNSP